MIWSVQCFGHSTKAGTGDCGRTEPRSVELLGDQGGEQQLHGVLRQYSVPVGKPALCPACHSFEVWAPMATEIPPLMEEVPPPALFPWPPLIDAR